MLGHLLLELDHIILREMMLMYNTIQYIVTMYLYMLYVERISIVKKEGQ